MEAKAFYKNIISNPKSSKLAAISSKLAWHVANITQGAVLGDGEGLGGAAGDIAASLVLYGDLRDLVLLGPKLFFGFGDPGDKLVLTFAAFGVITTVAPELDVFVGTGKVVMKKVAGSPIAPAIAHIADKILSSASKGHLVENALNYKNLFEKMASNDAYQQIVKKVFKRGTSSSESEIIDWVEELAKFENRYPSQNLVEKLEGRYRSIPGVDADAIIRNTISATRRVSDKLEPLGIKLSQDALEGIGVLMRYTNNPKKAETIVDTILQKASAGTKPQAIQNIFTWLKQAESASTLGLDKFTATLGNYPGFVQGGYHVLEHAANKVGFDNIAQLEFRAAYNRVQDILTKNKLHYELKNFTSYTPANIKTVLDQLAKDLDSIRRIPGENASNLVYVFRGTEAGAADMVAKMRAVEKNMKIDGSIKIIFEGKSVPF